MPTVFVVDGFTWCGLSPLPVGNLAVWLTRYNRPQGSGGSYIQPDGRFAGSNCMQLSGGSFWQEALLPRGVVSAPGTIYMGVAIKSDNWPISGPLIGFCDNGTGPQFGNDNVYAMVGSNNGKLAVYGGAFGSTLIATGTTPLQNNNYYYVEMKLTIGNAGTGRVLVYLDGVLEVDSGLFNTLRTLSGDVYGFFLRCPGAGFTAKYCDLYVADTLLGPMRVSTLAPNADGVLTQWTPSAGVTHFNLVNEEPPDGDATYVSSSTPGQIDLYQFPSLAYSPQSIFGVQVSAYARKDDVSARQIAMEVRSNGSNFVGVTQPNLGTTYFDIYLQCFNTDPSTGLAWVMNAVNAIQAGVNLIA